MYVLPNEHLTPSPHVTKANASYTSISGLLPASFQIVPISMSIPVQYVQAEAVPAQESKAPWLTSVQGRVVSCISSLDCIFVDTFIRTKMVLLLSFKVHCSDILGSFIQ